MFHHLKPLALSEPDIMQAQQVKQILIEHVATGMVLSIYNFFFERVDMCIVKLTK